MTVGKLHVTGRARPDDKSPWLMHQSPEGTGSCVFVDMPGANPDKIYAITCAHVVANAHPKLGVMLSFDDDDGVKFPVHVLGLQKQADTAILEVQNPTITKARRGPPKKSLRERISKIPLGKDRLLKTQNEVRAIGFSLGFSHAQDSLMKVSHRNKSKGLIQLEGSANPGMSGGAVLKGGELVGIIRAKTGEGIAFATPISHAMPLMQCVKKDCVNDMQLREMPFNLVVNNQDFMDFANLHSHGQGVVAQSLKHAVLQTGDMKEGDIVLKIRDPYTSKMSPIDFKGGVHTADGSTLSVLDILQQIPPDQAAEFTVISPSDMNPVPRIVKIQPRPSVSGDLDDTKTEHVGFLAQEIDSRQLGESLQALYTNQTISKKMVKPTTSRMPARAVVVSATYPGSHFHQNTALSKGQLILEVNEQPIETIAQYRAALLSPVSKNGSDFVSIRHVCGQACVSNSVAYLDTLKRELPLIQSLGVRVAEDVFDSPAEQDIAETFPPKSVFQAPTKEEDDHDVEADAPSEISMESLAESASLASAGPPAYKILLEETQ
jgi:S1-C subfamily serine protease